MDMNNTNHPTSLPVTSVQNLVPEHPIKNQRGKMSLILGVLVLLLIVGIGAYYLGTQNNKQPSQVVNNTPTPQPTLTSSPSTVPANSELKTYQGQSYSFQYQSDWTILKSDTNSITLQKEQMMEAQGAYPAQKIKVTLSVYSANIQSDTTLDKWLESRYLRSGDTNLFELTKQGAKKTTLGGSEALAIQVPGAGGYIDEGTVSVYKGKGYDVSIIGSEIQGSTDEYQMVLSTLKFTN